MSKRPPLDDAGLAIDQMLEVCADVVNQLHGSMGEKKTPQEMRDVAMTLDIVWNLTRDIIDFDIATSTDIDRDFDEGNPGAGPGVPPEDLDG